MINIIKGFARGKGAFKGVDQGITNVIKEKKHEMSKIQTFTPTPSNEDGVKDLLDVEMFVTTSKGYTYFFSYPKECLLQIAQGVW
jgi:hypothetical protein